MSNVNITSTLLPKDPIFPSPITDNKAKEALIKASEWVENARQANKNLSAINEKYKDIENTLKEKEKEFSNAEKKLADAEQKAETADRAEEIATYFVSVAQESAFEAAKEGSWYNDQWEQAKYNYDCIKKEHDALGEQLIKAIGEGRPEAEVLSRKLLEKGAEHSDTRLAEFQAEQEASRAAAKYEEAEERVRLSEENLDTARNNAAKAHEELNRARDENEEKMAQISKEIESIKKEEIESIKKELSDVGEARAEADKARDDADSELNAALEAQKEAIKIATHDDPPGETLDPELISIGPYENGIKGAEYNSDPGPGMLSPEEIMNVLEIINALYRVHDLTTDERSAYDDARNEFRAGMTSAMMWDLGMCCGSQRG
ncbi:MAG: hypothetical protein FD149_739 [Rhodospirillaceae bacterium]|nr:MAG: hypothetical protein FD149_739 [Rhodospirillaceae bacterium]